MRKRFYLFLSLFTVLSLSVVLTSTFADQKIRAKEKSPARDGQSKTDSESMQVFTVPAPGTDSSYLGVYLEEVSPDRAKELGLVEERGAIVTKVVEGSPAEKAGLKENDVVVAFNERRIDSIRELQRMLSETPADRNVKIEVMRAGSRQTITATLSKRTPGMGYVFNTPEWNNQAWAQTEEARKQAEAYRKRAEEQLREHPEAFKNFPGFGDFNSFGGPGTYTFFSGTRLGVSAESLTEQLADFFGVKDGQGVLVASVNENSAASRAGLKAGDVIVAVDDQKINDVGALVNALAKKEGSVSLKIIRNRAEQVVTVTLEKRTETPAPRRRAAVVGSQVTV